MATRGPSVRRSATLCLRDLAAALSTRLALQDRLASRIGEVLNASYGTGAQQIRTPTHVIPTSAPVWLKKSTTTLVADDGKSDAATIENVENCEWSLLPAPTPPTSPTVPLSDKCFSTPKKTPYTSPTKPTVGMSFENIEAAEQFYKNYAHENGFSVRVGQQRLENGIVYWKRFLCSRQGFRKKKCNDNIQPSNEAPLHQILLTATHSRQDEYEAFISCHIPNEVTVYPPTDICSKGRSKRIKKSKEASGSKKKQGRVPCLCKICKQLVLHDARNCPAK